jgi:hypothetical protein
MVDQTAFPGAGARVRVAVKAGGGDGLFAQGKADGPAQQAQADDRNLGKGASLMR